VSYNCREAFLLSAHDMQDFYRSDSYSIVVKAVYSLFEVRNAKTQEPLLLFVTQLAADLSNISLQL
jgi:hypothetical protein